MPNSAFKHTKLDDPYNLKEIVSSAAEKRKDVTVDVLIGAAKWKLDSVIHYGYDIDRVRTLLVGFVERESADALVIAAQKANENVA